MRVFRLRTKLSAAIVGAAVFGAFAGVALGSAGVGFAPTNLVTGNLNNDVKLNSDRVKFQTKDRTDVRVQRIEIAPGGFSGWHHHPGIVIVVVESGQVTFTNSDCSSTTYGPGLPAGSAFVEGGDDPGQRAVLPLIPRGSGPVKRTLAKMRSRCPYEPGTESDG